jgi:acetylornithine deacetylase
MFNAHSDVVSAGREEKWKFGPWSGIENAGRFYGRGACDVKGPLVSAIWAMVALRRLFPDGLGGKLLLELVPGEEDCVTLGTLTSLVRGYRADACIVLEPTECLPRNASRPGLRFEILCRGRAVHGTVKWLGEDAIALSQVVLSSLSQLEKRWNDPSADPLFSVYPIARPITVDTVRGGEWQGMICDECKIGGYLELLPKDEPADWMKRLTLELTELLDHQGQDSRRISVDYPETYKGHRLESESSLCRTAEALLEKSGRLLQNTNLTWNGWSGFNSGCEAGLRANLENTPTLVWGPGSLSQAHAADEFVEFHQVESVARLFAYFGRAWTGLPKETI